MGLHKLLMIVSSGPSSPLKTRTNARQPRRRRLHNQAACITAGFEYILYCVTNGTTTASSNYGFQMETTNKRGRKEVIKQRIENTSGVLSSFQIQCSMVITTFQVHHDHKPSCSFQVESICAWRRHHEHVYIGNIYSRTGSPNGGVPQGTLSGPKCFYYI